MKNSRHRKDTGNRGKKGNRSEDKVLEIVDTKEMEKFHTG